MNSWILAYFFKAAIDRLYQKSDMITLKGCGCNVAIDDGPPPPTTESLPDTHQFPGEYGYLDCYFWKAAIALVVNGV